MPPIVSSQIKEVIALAKQAPYGKGEKTIVDTTVRKCWEIDEKELIFHDKKWDKMVSGILLRAETYLDLTAKSLKAHLYKMLIYEPGGFFLPHQDSEKLPGMVATLVICLPSKHEGGELIISKGDEKVSFSASSNEKNPLFKAVLFYADCIHELKPLISGYRVCFTYNVTLNKKKNANLIEELHLAELNKLTEELKLWKNCKNRSNKLVVGLSHQYS